MNIQRRNFPETNSIDTHAEMVCVLRGLTHTDTESRAPGSPLAAFSGSDHGATSIFPPTRESISQTNAQTNGKSDMTPYDPDGAKNSPD